ncbi:endonuclease/exonuclease/phosphatase family protein [Promicromonospora panici]|uniref:endonuclease/exonuclease/phosphatase family protein n=1 Tax=Promicromonospora panici TaxID=2219658 RepID=UPI00101CC5BE|nr:endonuclease/exonuclease/phosphatase family protein [Promicromonospora panici]
MTTATTSESAPRVRVLTMNVFGPGNPDWDRRHRLTGDTIRSLDPDIVALQEVPVGSPEILDRLIGPGYHLTHFSRPSDDGVAGTLATRWPHRLVTEIDLGVSERSRRVLPWGAALLVELDTPLGRMLVTHHKPTWPLPFELEREQQAILVARAMEDHIGDRDVHALVVGDFDAAPNSDSMRFWQGRGTAQQLSVCYQDAWEYAHPGEPGHTFELANPLVRDGEFGTATSRRIDYILVRSGLRGPTLQVTDCRRVLDQPVGGVWASDHYGVVADLVGAQRISRHTAGAPSSGPA